MISIWSELNLILQVLTVILGIATVLESIYFISNEIRMKMVCKEYCSYYEEAVNLVKTIHNQRYRSYIEGDTKNAEQYTKIIKETTRDFIEAGQEVLKSNEFNFSNKQKQQIQKGIEELKYFRENIMPKNRTL